MLRFLRRRPPLLRFLSSSSPSSANPALVIGTLRRHGIPDGLCSSVVARFPRILTLKPHETLAPKLAFLRSQGFSGPEVATILLHNPYVLLHSLRWFLAPSMAQLKNSFPGDDLVGHIVHNRWSCPCGFPDNVDLLRHRGVPELSIEKLERSHFLCLSGPQRDFFHRVEFIEKLNIMPSTAAFATALRMLHGMSRAAIQRKVRLYRRLGWAEEELLRVFRLQPTIMRLSDEVVRKKVAFFGEALGWGPEFLSRYPEIMTMSVEKRIAPRCAVLDLLMCRGLIRRTTHPVRELKVSDARFVEEFVEKHEEAAAPGVARAYYAGEVEFKGWSWLEEDAENQPLKKLASS